MTMTTWTCVRCATTIDPFVLSTSDDDDFLPDLTEEAESWLPAWDGKGGWLCPDCATQPEKWRDDNRCSRCGVGEPPNWSEFSDLEWLRVVEDGGVCPECWVPTDAEAETAALEQLRPLIGKHGLSWSEDVLQRNAQALEDLARLRAARGPDEF